MPESEDAVPSLTFRSMRVGEFGRQFSITMEPYRWWHWRGMRARLKARRRGERYTDQFATGGPVKASACSALAVVGERSFVPDPRHMLECCPNCGAVPGQQHGKRCTS